MLGVHKEKSTGFNDSREGSLIGTLHGKASHSHLGGCVGGNVSASLEISQLIPRLEID